MSSLRIALLYGGPSTEREVSIKGKEAVKRALEKLGYHFEEFDVAFDLTKLANRKAEFDCAFIVVHGAFGEDGRLQGFLECLSLPYQGADVLGSSLAIHKGISKMLYKEAGLLVPEGCAFSLKEKEKAIEYARQIGFPLIVKPCTHGSSVGLFKVKNEEELNQALEEIWKIDREVLIEEYISGKEVTVGILGEEALPVVEICPKEREFFDYKSKYTPGLTEEICPARLDAKLYKKVQEAGLIAHRALKLRHYSRTDMIIKDQKIYVLETNTIPGMTETSLLPLAAKVAGYSFEELVKKLIELALSEKGKIL